MLKRGKLFSKSIAVVVALLMASTVVGCGDKKPAQMETPANLPDGNGGTVEETGNALESDSDSFFPFGEAFYDGRWYSGELSNPEEPKNAADIYASVKYTEQMFYGDYRLNHPHDGVQTSYASKMFTDSCAWMPSTNVSSTISATTISTIPYRIVAGNAELDNALITDETHNWCQVYYATNNGDTSAFIDAAYTVSGNTITFIPVTSWSFNESTGDLTYEFEDKSISYDFEFCGPKLTLSTENESYTLIERDFTSWLSHVTENSVSVESSLSTNSRPVDDIVGIDMAVTMNEDGSINMKKCAFTLKTLTAEGNEKTCSGIAKWDEDGLFTFSYEDANGSTRVHQLVMFYCGFDGLILSDGKKNYYYLSTFLSEVSSNHYTIEDLGMNVSEEDQKLFETMTEEEIEEIFETREDLLSDLSVAFSQNGIAAEIDDETGEIVLDSSILFATGQSDLSGDGKKALTAFITAFTSVISDDKYDGFISRVEVQGHTDTDGDYDYNLELSQKRANSVRDYSLSGEVSLPGGTSAKLESLLDPVGYSYDHPVYNEDGTVNMAASRRVEFIFYINLAGR